MIDAHSKSLIKNTRFESNMAVVTGGAILLISSVDTPGKTGPLQTGLRLKNVTAVDNAVTQVRQGGHKMQCVMVCPIIYCVPPNPPPSPSNLVSLWTFVFNELSSPSLSPSLSLSLSAAVFSFFGGGVFLLIARQ